MGTEVQEAKQRKPPQEFEVVVKERIPESPDTVTLVLDPLAMPAGLRYRAGQFLTIDARQFPALNALQAELEAQKGHRESARAYSLTSSPHEPGLAITVKDEPFEPGHHRYRPLLAPYLVHQLNPGTRFKVKGFNGPYVLPDELDAGGHDGTETILHLVAGSGAVPNFSILKDALHRGLGPRHLYLASNKTVADVLFRRALDALAVAHPGRLQIIHTLTRETEENGRTIGARQGRITRELLQELVPDPSVIRAFVCGPAITSWDRRAALASKTQATPRFLESVLAHLHAIGVSDKRIKREAYG